MIGVSADDVRNSSADKNAWHSTSARKGNKMKAIKLVLAAAVALLLLAVPVSAEEICGGQKTVDHSWEASASPDVTYVVEEQVDGNGWIIIRDDNSLSITRTIPADVNVYQLGIRVKSACGDTSSRTVGEEYTRAPLPFPVQAVSSVIRDDS